jgi:hypothetical protein
LIRFDGRCRTNASSGSSNSYASASWEEAASVISGRIAATDAGAASSAAVTDWIDDLSHGAAEVEDVSPVDFSFKSFAAIVCDVVEIERD